MGEGMGPSVRRKGKRGKAGGIKGRCRLVVVARWPRLEHRRCSGMEAAAAQRSRLTDAPVTPDRTPALAAAAVGAGRWAAGGPLAPAPCAVPRDFSRSAYVSLGTCSSRRNACRSETLMCLARAVPEQLVTRRRRGDGVGRRADTIICPDAPSREKKKLGFAAVNKCKQAGVNVLVAVL